MDPLAKKRKSNESGGDAAALTPDDITKILEPFTHDQLLDVVKSALSSPSPSALLDAVRAVADRDPAQRNLFVSGLSWETTTDSLRAVYAPFGDVEKAVVITDKATGRSKGYGFVTFRHIDAALRSLKDPSKKIDGRITVTNLASLGKTSVPAPDIADDERKIYVGNVPPDMAPDRLLAHFAAYGEIEAGPLGYDKQTCKFRGYSLFVYKTVEAARSSLVDPIKNIDGHNVLCKLADTNLKKKVGDPLTLPTPVGVLQTGVLPGTHPGVPPTAEGSGLSTQPSLPGQFGLPGSGQPFPGYHGLPAADERKIYVGNVPPDMAYDSLLAHFAAYGEIEAGPLGYDKQTCKFRGYSLFIYKTVEAARSSLVDPIKNIDGHNVLCKLADTNLKKKVGGPLTLPTPVGVPQTGVLPGTHPGVPPTAEGSGLSTQPSLPGQFGLPGSGQPFPGYHGLPAIGGLGNHHPLASSLPTFGSGTPVLLSSVSQAPSSLSGFGAGGYGGLGGPYGPSSQYGSQGTGAYAGLGIGSSLYRMPPGSGGMLTGGYPETGHYSLSSSGVQNQHHHTVGSPGRRIPSYPSLPPYF